MNTKDYMDMISKQIDDNFNVDNQLVEYVISELNQMNLQISQEQAQHIVNIIEYISKATSKSSVITMTNSLIELGLLKSD